MQQNVLVATAREPRGQSEIPRPGGRALLAAAAAALLLAACASTGNAPVVDKTAEPSAPAAVLPGQENAGKPGYYSVRPGDTLSRIARETGQTTANLVRWNSLDNPDRIEVGQVLRVVPPVAGISPAPAVSSAPVNGSESGRVQARPLAPAAAPAAAAPAPLASASAATPESVTFSWPVSGSVLDRFDETRNKGIDLAGKAGDPVLAAADGKVVYAGSGLRGYGNLVILKHNNTYLTAYAHNQALLVKEDQTVRQGQKIAEMGSSDSERVKLHFEVRRNGKPVDPLKYLPAR